MITIGITGTLGAGKGTIVDYLQKEKGFSHYSVRAFLIDEIKARGMEVNRDSMTLVGNDLRAQHSPSWIIEQLYQQAQASGKNCIIESIRTPGEVDTLRSKPNFYLFAVDADPRVRYDRAVLRGSETDHIDYDTFLADEQREMDNADPNKQNLKYCIQQADYCFDNNGTIDDLNQQVEQVLGKIMYRRPSWDEYFMELANTASKRATCDRGRSGCVIVKDRQLLVTASPLRRGGTPLPQDHRSRRPHHHPLRPHRPCRAERHLPGRPPRHSPRRRHPILPHDPLPHLRHAHHQLRHQARSVRTQIPHRRRERRTLPPSRRPAGILPRRNPAIRQPIKIDS